MIVYLAGPITGTTDWPQRFGEAARMVEAAGHEPMNPCAAGERSGWEWADYMRAALTLLMGCEGVALLPGWRQSRGATIERDLGVALGLDVRTLAEWVTPVTALIVG